MNQLTIMGHLGADPEVRYTSSGQKVTTLRVAENQRRLGKEETIWWRVTIWGENLDKILSFFKKGSAIIVTGEMAKPEIYNDREGNPQISLNLTAYHIAFSPFGRGDLQQKEEPSFAQSKQGFMPKESRAFESEETFAQKKEPTLSEGKGELSLADGQDDEIPF